MAVSPASTVVVNSLRMTLHRICFGGLHSASALGGLGSGTNGNNNGRPSAITTSVLCTLNLQLAIRLVSFAQYSQKVAHILLSARPVMGELLDAANCRVASSFASSLSA